MSNVVRRKGKPNRGGGKFNKRGGGGRGRGGIGKHGGGGGGGSRKSAMDMDLYDDDFTLDGAWGNDPPAPSGAPSRYGRGSSARGRGGSRGVGSFRGGGSSFSGGRGSSRGGASARGVRGRGAIIRPASSNHDRPKSSFSGPVAKVPMQRLYMTTENQDMVRDMLRDLHGQDQELDQNMEVDDEEEVYDEDDYYEGINQRTEDQYWMTDNKLCVEAAEKNVTPLEDTDVFSEEHVSKIAVNKITRYGFDKERSLKALVKTEGDIGQALEMLLNDCFDLGLNIESKQSQDKNQNRDFQAEGEEGDNDDFEEEKPNPKLLKISEEEVAEQRAEEMLVLESIYGSAFSERLPGRVWVLGLKIPHLDALVEASSGMHSLGGTQWKVPVVDDRPPCRFFQRGSCKFGANRCRYKHEAPYKAEPVESYKDSNPGDDSFNYELEIRFPLGNKYPFEPPVLAFSTRNKDMPYNVCLNITRRLYVEARELAESDSPAVFPLVSVLENEDDLTRLFGEPPMPFSNPPPVIRRQAAPPPPAPIEVIRNAHVVNRDQKERKVEEEPEAPASNDEDEEEDTMDPEERQESMRQKYAQRRKNVLPRAISRHEQQRLDSRAVEQFKRKQKDPAYKKMQEKRQELPAWNKQDDVLDAVMNAQVVVISGMTGCGKSTQVPQYVLDASLQGKNPRPANIVCTQPRRISAMAVAERVADERAEKCGGTVGYQIRLESCTSSRTRLLFCTTGILLRRLEGDGNLSDVTHVILDEVHERTEESDFLLMVLRDLIYERPDLKLILMSATLNASLFSEYFADCPTVEIPGRTFPVDQFFLEDAIEYTRYTLEERSPYARSMKTMNAHPGQGKGGRGGGGGGRIMEDIDDELKRLSISTDLQPAKDNVQDQNLTLKQLYIRYSDYKRSTIKTLATMDPDKINYEMIESLLEWIVYGDHEYPEGAVLVFLPGLQEITTLYEQLQNSSTFGSRNKHKFKLIPLHSTLSSEEQHTVFSRPKEGVTKIVISTNIAETSITIDDVVYVIDAGRMKEKRYDSDKGMESLESVWVSRANALQRRGRAGRVASGVSFHLFTGHRFEFHLRDQPIPEIQRAPLESIVLRIKVLDIFFGYRVEDVLNKLIEPPPETSVSNAVKRLQDLGALDLDSYLTPLGYHLAALPVDVRIGKLMLFGSIFRCLDSALTIAAMLSFKSPFVSPFDKRDEADKKKLEFATCNSDHLTMLKAYMGWISAQKQGGRSGYLYCMDNFLSIKTMQMLASMKRQFVELLSDIGFIQEGLTTRRIERNFRDGDGVIEATGPEANSNNANMKLVAAMLVGALFPNVVQVMTPENKYMQSGTGAIPKAPRPEDLKFKTKMDGYVNIHPSSINFQVRHYESPYLVYHEKIKTSKVYIRDCTMVSVYPLLLFGGSITIDLDRGEFMLSVDDGWIKFLATSQIVAELVRELRLELDQLLQDKIETPNMDLRTCPRGSRIIDTIVRLVTTQ